MNVHVKKGILWAVLVGLTAWAIHSCPASAVKHLGGLFSPKGEISDVFIPVFHRALVILGSAFSSMALGAFLWRHSLFAALAGIIRKSFGELRSVLRSMLWHLRQLSTAERVAMMLILVIGVGIRLWYLNQPMRFDEAATACLYASSPWYIGVANYSTPNNHVLNTLLMRLSIVWLGNREWVLRLPAFMAGLACLPLAYAYARRMHSRAAAILTLALVSVALPFVDMGTNGRGYSFVAACGLAMILCAEVLLRRGGWLAWIGYALAAGLSLVAVPVALPFVLTSVIWALAYAGLLHRRGWRVLPNLRWLIAAGAAGAFLALLGYAPMMLVMGVDRLLSNEWVTPGTLRQTFVTMPGYLMDYAAYVLAHLPGFLPTVLGVAGAWYVVRWRRIEQTGLSLSFLMAGVCTGVLLAIRRYPDWGLSPMWMTLSIVGLAALSAALGDLAECVASSRSVRAGASGLAVILAISGSWGLVRANPCQTMDPLGYYSFADADQVVKYLAGLANPEDEILMDNGFAIHHYYTWARGATNLSWRWEGSGPRRVFALETPQTNPRYARAMRDRLRGLGIDRTENMTQLARFPNHRIWMAEVE